MHTKAGVTILTLDKINPKENYHKYIEIHYCIMLKWSIIHVNIIILCTCKKTDIRENINGQLYMDLTSNSHQLVRHEKNKK